MNENFIRVFKDSGMTMYRLSHASGVPYTTINEVVNCKKDINTKSAETISRLAYALGTEERELLNPIHYLDGAHGKYRRYKYKWKYDGTMKLDVEHGDDCEIIDTGYQLTNAKDREIYSLLHMPYINIHISEKESREALEKAMSEKI